MKSKKLRRICALVLATALTLTSFVGCGKSSSGVSTEGQTLVYNLGEDPDTIDPTLNTSSGASTLIMNCFEGLMKLDENSQPTYGVAKDMEVSEDGLVYTFKLREDAKWSDGQAVTANDFAYSWVRALTKEVGADYYEQLFYIKNGEKFYNGEVSREELGINVVDEHTLEVTLEYATTYFNELVAFTTYMPLREDIVSANPEGWANTAETYVSNGAFKLTQWDMKDQFVLEKNENYWDKDSVKLDKLVMKMVKDVDSAYASLESSEFDMVDSVPPNLIEQGQQDGLVTIYPNLANYFIAFNVGNNDTLSPEVQKALENKNVRKALSLAIDRQSIVENVTKGGQVPAYSYVPQGILNADGEEFASKEYYDASKANIEEAKELLAEAGYPNGEGLPTLEFMYNSEGSHKDVAQVLQQNWKEIGVNVELTNQEWKVFLNTRKDGGYQIARHGWTGDYIDPMTFLDMWTSANGNNDAKFSNAEFDTLIADAKKEADATKRWDMLRKAEDILMEEMPIIPLYYYTKIKGMKPEVKDVVVTIKGNVLFQNAYIGE